MLSAAVCGGVFASPSYQDVLKAILQVGNENGVLLIIKNYTGDRINFELAANIAKTKGMKVESLLVADDISLEEGEGVGRRGLAGTVLLYKILGAAANYLNLSELADLGNKILKKTYTIGASVTACSLPGNPPMYTLPPDEMEIGLGIHGEKGLKRIKMLPCNLLVNSLCEKIEKCVHKKGDCVLMINNLGSTTDMEISIICKEVIKSMKSKGFNIKRIISGKIMTSFEMHGFSITCLNLAELENNEKILKFLEEKDENFAWKISEINDEIYVPLKHDVKLFIDKKIKQKYNENGQKFVNLLKSIFENLRTKEIYYNSLDAEVGDGDLGVGVAKTSEIMLKNLEFFPWETDLIQSFIETGEIMAQGFGGTTGPLYAFFFIKGAQKLMKNLSENTIENWYQAFQEGFNSIKMIGKAELKDRTMLDALFPAMQTFNEIKNLAIPNQEKAIKIAEAAKNGAEEASKLKAKRGRSSYLQGKEIGKKEPGCELVKDWIQLISENLKKFA